METKGLKQYILSALMVMAMFVCHAQKASKLKLHSVSVGVGYFDELSNDHETYFNGFNTVADVALSLDDILFSAYSAYGYSPGFLITDEATYLELNATVGKAWFIKDWLTLEGHLGLGYFTYTLDTFHGKEKLGALNFPFRLKANFPLSDHLAIVLNPNINLAIAQGLIFSGGLGLQYKF